jgi:hypothetical protein
MKVTKMMVLTFGVLLLMLAAVMPVMAMPVLVTETFPAGSYVVPMDGQQAALSKDDTTVYGFIWKILTDGGCLCRVIEPPDVNLKTDANPGGAVYSGGVVLIDPAEADVPAAMAAFPTVTVEVLQEAFTTDKCFPVKYPTEILVVDGIWGHTDEALDNMGVPYDLTQRSNIEADPTMVNDYNLVLVDCPGWSGATPSGVAAALDDFARRGGEVIFTDIALEDLDEVFPGYVSVVTNVNGVWDTTIHNPPITGFPAEYPSQYPSDFPTDVKIYTMGGGKIVDSLTQPGEVRVWMDSDTYGPDDEYCVLGFYFPYGEGVVQGMAYHPQEQVEGDTRGTGDPNSFVAGTVFFGNKLVFATAPPPEKVPGLTTWGILAAALALGGLLVAMVYRRQARCTA